MIRWEAHIFCDRCNDGRMQGTDRGYLRAGTSDAEGEAYAAGWRRRFTAGNRCLFVCPECVAEIRAEIAKAVPLPLFDEVAP